MKLLLSIASLLAASQGFAATGFVTPSELTITFTQISIIRTDNTQITVLSGSYPTTFRKTDTDFAAISMAGITAPEGRFGGVRICYDTARTVKLNGDLYRGQTSNSYDDGDPVYSVGTGGATAANSVSLTAPTTATTLSNYVVGNGTNNCSDSYFATPVCVSTDSSRCESTDNRVDPGSTVPNVNIMLDLFNAVAVDATTNSLDNHIPVYPYPTIGRPGAAVHITSPGAGSGLGNISLLFGNDRKLLYSAAYMTGSVPGFCSGNGFVTATAAPSGSYLNPYGPTAVQLFTFSTGKLQFAAGNCGTGTTCTSNGINVIDNVLRDVGQTPGVTCVADNLADPSKLGFTYTAGAGDSSGPSTFTIKKIIDPANILGHCASPPCGDY